MIEISGLTKQYAGTTVLTVPELTVPDNALTYLLGLNGAGKSTLLRCICGTVAPDTGTVAVDGTRLRAQRDIALQLGMHMNYRAFHPNHTARRHLRWIAAAGGISKDRVAEVLRLVELSDAADKRLSQYSLGMLQRVGIAAALLGDARTIVLDEPVNGLDIGGIRWARVLFRRLADEGRCLLVATHLLSEVERSGDRVVVLGAGQVLIDVSLDEMTELSESGDAGLEDSYARIAGLDRAGAVAVS